MSADGWGRFDPPLAAFARIAELAVLEDAADGDPTGSAIGSRPASANLVARSAGTIAGLPSVTPVLDAASSVLGRAAATVELELEDGDAVAPGSLIGRISGPADTIVGAERSLLNLLCHLSGVATLTASFVAAVAGSGARVRDTRKTLPGLRQLEKYAVRCGGGVNHRMGLGDALLVKDNHIAALGSLAEAVAQARRRGPGLPLEVEVDTIEQVVEALDVGCELLLLDNMDPETIQAAVALTSGLARTEASGGITIQTVGRIAACGVDYVSVGALTHSAPALDIGLDWQLGD